MRKSLKIARTAQLIGALFLVFGIVSCSQRSDPQMMSWQFIIGLLLVIGARTYEWFTKE